MMSFPEIYEEVVGRAGGEQSTAEDVIRVERSVRIVLERWQAMGFPTWRIKRTEVAVSGSSSMVRLPDNVDDVMRVQLRRSPHTIDLLRISGPTYMQLSSKERTGTPAQYWLNRSVPPELHIFPIGDPHRQEMIDLWYIERPKEFERGYSETEGVPGRWLEALICACAHDFARKRPGEGGAYDETLIARLDGERREAEDLAKMADRDKSTFTYRTSYSR